MKKRASPITITPAFYVNYFELRRGLVGDGLLTIQVGLRAIATYAMSPLPGVGGMKKP